ncbi:MAG: type III pantothenate kinase [Sideroxydans sp.]|nr:type III pantothenate kinase [Sideroxydans sp.]
MLLLDVGNSRCKWALVRDGQWMHKGALGNTEFRALQQAFAKLPAPSRILVSNVAGAPMAERVQALCAGWQCPLQFVQARAEQCGVRNAYQHPQRLGSDRWAALIAAWHRVRGACLVVNCGTATTVDALSAEGEFLGGLILPGVYLMQQSLLGNTAQLKETDGALCDFPLNTADAIHSGILRATLGAIEHQYALLVARYAGVRCVLSGGAADKVQPHLGMALEHKDNLVLHGLQIMGEDKQ